MRGASEAAKRVKSESCYTDLLQLQRVVEPTPSLKVALAHAVAPAGLLFGGALSLGPLCSTLRWPNNGPVGKHSCLIAAATPDPQPIFSG